MPPSHAPIRVLHVDDEPAVAQLTAEYLERECEDLEVVTARSPAAGRTVLAEQAIDCVISDVDMPGENGIEFLRSVREAFPELPFILFTAHGSEELASEAISAGVTAFVQKTHGTEQYRTLAARVTDAVEGQCAGADR